MRSTRDRPRQSVRPLHLRERQGQLHRAAIQPVARGCPPLGQFVGGVQHEGDPEDRSLGRCQDEVFCNKTAALILVPEDDFRTPGRLGAPAQSLDDQIDGVSKRFRVSPRLSHTDCSTPTSSSSLTTRIRRVYTDRWRISQERDQGSGGDYYRNMVSKNGRRYTRTVLGGTLLGQNHDP